MNDVDRRQMDLLEQDAELLAAYQLDLLAQLERQLRAVHLTMRHIERLRGAKHRVGPELSNSSRETILTDLATDISALDAQLDIEHACCEDMHRAISEMRLRVGDLRQRSTVREGDPDSDLGHA